MDDEFELLLERITPALRTHDLTALRQIVREQDAPEIVRLLEREDDADRAVLYRLLARDQALEVFELLDGTMRKIL